MGEGQSTQKKGTVPVYNKVIDKTKLEIVLKKIFFTTQLQRDRKKGLLAQKEKELLGLIAQPKVQRNKDSEYAKASAIVSDVKTVKAQDAVMRYCDIVKDRALVIEQSKGDPSKINDLLPFIESIVWGSKNLNLECIKDLEIFLHNSFGPEVYGLLSKGANVQPELRECFDSVLPSDKEIKKYLIEFCKKNSIEIELMNEIGHNISESILLDIPDNNTQGPTNGGNNTGGFPGGGYPGGGYPSGGGGGTVQVDPSANIKITIGTNIYPNQYQPYQQQNYQPQQYQQNYQPQQYQQQYQPTLQQPTYQQPTYQQQQPYQPTYQQQQPYQQPTTQQQPTYQQPTYQQPTYQQPTTQQQQPFQDPKFQAQPYQPQFQQNTGTTGGNQTPTPTTTNTTTTTNVNAQVKTQPLNVEYNGDSSYPTFKKMQIDPYPGGPKNDLDDFQARLKNIKDGL